MSLKAGRVGVNPAQVNPVDGSILSSAISGYTKQEADAKFETQANAASTYETKSEASAALALKQPINLQLPIELLSGSALTVESALQGLNSEKFTYADNGVLGAKNLLDNEAGKFTMGSGNVSFEKLSTGIRITAPSGTNRYAITILDVSPDTDYILCTDVVPTKGKGHVTVTGRTGSSGGWTPIVDSSDFSADESYNITFNTGSYDHLRIVFYCTTSTDEEGDVSYTDLMLRLASDPDTTYQPYAMTNRELTDYTISKSSAVTDIISGASVDTSVMGNELLRIGNCVYLKLSLSGVSASEWSDTIFKIPYGFRPAGEKAPRFMDSDNTSQKYKVDSGAGNTSSVKVVSQGTLSSATVNICQAWITTDEIPS